MQVYSLPRSTMNNFSFLITTQAIEIPTQAISQPGLTPRF